MLEEFNSMRLPPGTKMAPNADGVCEKRYAVTDFVSNEARYENSLKLLPVWLEGIFITALIHSFGPVLNEAA